MTQYSCGDDMELFFRRLPTQRGSGMMNDGRMYFAGVRRMRGAGIGGIFGSIARKLLPFAQKYILPQAMDVAKNVISDLGQGRNLRESLKENASAALKNVGKQYFNQSGSGIRRRKKVRGKTKPVKRKKVSRKHKKIQNKATKKTRRRKKSKVTQLLNTIFH